MTQRPRQPNTEPQVILVPCAHSGRAGCEIVRRAVDLVAADIPEAVVAEAKDCPRGRGRFVVAVDASSACRASAALESCGTSPSAVVSAPRVLAEAGLVKRGVDLRARADALAQALAGAIRASLREALAEARERSRYRQEMTPVLQRFRGLWGRVEALPAPPDGRPEEEVQARVELLARRSRNLFMRLEQISPPGRWAEPHDLFQDALLCIAYACEGWAMGDARRWEQNLEKARLQVRPLLRRLE